MTRNAALLEAVAEIQRASLGWIADRAALDEAARCPKAERIVAANTEPLHGGMHGAFQVVGAALSRSFWKRMAAQKIIQARRARLFAERHGLSVHEAMAEPLARATYCRRVAQGKAEPCKVHIIDEFGAADAAMQEAAE